jgi:mannose-6-phosphate isomerase
MMKLKTHLVEKPWGRLDIPAAFNVPAGKKIGEIWYDDGTAEPLPLLVKWLFTSEKLSVQVHPNDEQARERGLLSGKEECWYIVDAAPGAVLGMGTLTPLSDEELRSASLDGSIEDLMDWRTVKAGDYFYIPAGTVHAIGAGIALVEVQQYADITYRLYDYGRLDNGQPRALHLDDGVAVSQAQPYTDQRSGHAEQSAHLANGAYFQLSLVTDEAALAALPIDRLGWIVPLSGVISVGDDSGAVGDCLLAEPGKVITMEDDAKFLWAVAGSELRG